MIHLFFKSGIPLLVFLLIIPLYSQDDLRIIEQPPMKYVYMEFRLPYENIFEKAALFQRECEKQQVQSMIMGDFFIILLEDEPPIWRLCIPVDPKVTVQPPLHTAHMGATSLAKNSQILSTVQNAHMAIARTMYKAREMGLRINGPNMLRWLNHSYPIQNDNNEIEILLPIREIGSLEGAVISIYRFVISTATFLYLFFIVFLLSQRKVHKTSNILLMCFLFSLFMGKLFNWIVGYYVYSAFVWCPHLFYIGSPFAFLIAPLLFLYTLSLLYKNFTFTKGHLIHVIPFAAVFLLLFFRFFRFDADLKREIFMSDAAFSDSEESLNFMLLNIQTVAYVVAALVILRTYRKEIKNSHSAIDKLYLPWLSFVLIGFLITHFSGMLKHLVYRYLGIYSEILAAMLLASYFLFPLIIVYNGLRHPEIFSGVERNGLNKKWSLPQSYSAHYAQKLERLMQTEKLYMTPGITIDELSKHIGISSRNLSAILNTHFNQNFFDFINQHRVAEAQRRLSQSPKKHNVMQVLYEVGFNSKSSFYKAFKKHTGISPTQYQES